MARLKKEEKLFIVWSLAQFNTPKETADLIQDELGVTVTPQQCEAYDPTKRSGQNLSAELRQEFEEARKQFLDKPKNIPIANQAVRLQRLEKLYIKHSKNPILAAAILKQAAQEEGGQFTNRKDVTTNGESLNIPMPTVIELVAPDVKGTDTTAT